MRTSFRRRLVKFHQLQTNYQPEVTPLLSQLPPNVSAAGLEVDSVQDAPLLLPSSLPPEVLSKCSKRLVLMEKELHIGQCRDCLSQIRTKLTAQARLLKHKYINIRNTTPNTRSRGLVNRVVMKVEVLAARYDHALKMLRALDLSDSSKWRSEFFQLGPQDLRCMGEAQLPSAPTKERAEELRTRSLLNGGVMPEGNRTVSWIWRGSLKDTFEGRVGEKEYGEGLSLNPSSVFEIADSK
jgi:hypothetical protein